MTIAPTSSPVPLPAADFNVLVTGPDWVTPAEVDGCRARVPTYGGRLEWTIAADTGAIGETAFDLSIVTCSVAARLPAAVAMAQELVRRRETTILLVPCDLRGAASAIDGALLVAAPGRDVVGNLELLATVLLAPVLADGWVCVDWADVMTVLDDGSEAILLSGTGATPPEAIAALFGHRHGRGIGRWFGACGALSAGRGVTPSDYRTFFDAVAARTRPDALRVLTTPEICEAGARACVLALTRPSTRLRMKRATN